MLRSHAHRVQLLPFLGLVGACDCGSGGAIPPDVVNPVSQPTGETSLARSVSALEPLPATFQRGVSYAHSYQRSGRRGYGTEVSKETHQQLLAIGVQWLSLSPFAYMAGSSATEVRLLTERDGAENDRVLGQEVRWARQGQMKTMLKPHIWIRGGVYRGEIGFESDEDWRRWWQSYRRFMLHYAELAQRLSVDLLCLGVELDQTAGPFEAEWRALIASVRAVFSGRIVYAANWDRVERIPFWDALDYVGVQFYPPLERAGASPEARLHQHLGALSSLSKHTGRPVLLTEVGFRSTPDALAAPHRWPDVRRDRPDQEAQARGYELLFRALPAHPEVTGAYLWKWFTDPDTTEEGAVGFSPQGKLAQQVLEAAYRLPHRAAPTPPPPPGRPLLD